MPGMLDVNTVSLKRFCTLKARCCVLSIIIIAAVFLPGSALASNALSGDRFISFNSTTQLRVADNTSSLLGELGLKFGTDQWLNLFAMKSTNETAVVADTFGVAYRARIGGHMLSFRSLQTKMAEGISRFNYGVGFKYRLPTRSIGSTVVLGYRSNEDVNTVVEVRYAIAKKLFKGSAIPVKLSANSRWRQREAVSGSVVEGIGGAVGLNLLINPKFSLDVDHTSRDKISAQITSVAATYSTSIGGNPVSVKLGANSRDTAFLTLKTGR